LTCDVAVAIKLLDEQVLLDLLEEQLELLAAFVQSSDGQGWQARIVGQEDQCLLDFRVFAPDRTQFWGSSWGDVVHAQYVNFPKRKHYENRGFHFNKDKR
jgi:hypothetical protein